MNTKFKNKRFKKLSKMQKRMVNNLRRLEKQARVKVLDFNWECSRLIVRTNEDGKKWKALLSNAEYIAAIIDNEKLFHIRANSGDKVITVSFVRVDWVY